MRKFKLPIQEEITEDLILDLIDKHRLEKHRILKLKRYYDNNNDIMKRPYTDGTKPQNKLSHGYASLITNSFVGYFLGKPVAYKSDNENLLNKLNNFFMYNDESDENTTLAQEASICGYAYEIMYMDQDAQLRFKQVPTEEMIVVYDNTLEENIQFTVRYYDVYNLDNEDVQEVEVYTKDRKIVYACSGNSLSIKEGEGGEYYFNDVPVVDYENNKERTGDFEKVISLIDAYDKSNSDTANDFEYFTEALLVISGVLMDETDEEGRPLNFKENRVLNFADNQAKAEYLIKNINDTALENYKNRLNNDILRFANVVDMTDENFASNLSGVAIKYKLMSMEHVTGIKESKFKKGLMRRIELASTILSIKTNSLLTYTEIKPVFTRNIPANETEIVSMVKQLYGIVSDETALSLLPFIENAKGELETKLKEDEEKAITEYNNFESSNTGGVVNEEQTILDK